jgi:hypothetical protein
MGSSKFYRVLVVSCIGFYIINNLAMSMGLVLYARYHGCDPVAAGVCGWIKVVKSKHNMWNLSNYSSRDLV